VAHAPGRGLLASVSPLAHRLPNINHVYSTVGIEINLDVVIDMASDYELLSYKDIADRLGIKLPSVRQTVSRRKWRRVKQNDGTVKIEVPLSYLQREIVAVDVNPVVNVDVDVTVEIAALKAENAYLHQRIADLQGDRDSWKEFASRPFWKRLLG